MKNIKKLAVTLAFSQLLSTNTLALANEKNNDCELVKCNYTLVSEKNNLYSFEEENDNYYCRFNENSGKYEPISIFDEENISSSQYGANQKDFKINFKKIIRDPLIINEMQNYYPIEEFESIDEAMFFYEKYFDLIYKCGCGYVAATNYIFHLYEGKEEEFYNTFGYPMYNISKDGSIDFNYEIFTLSFFNFSIKEMGISKKEIINSILKDWYERKLNEYMKSEEYTKKLPDNFQSWTDEEWNEWNQFDKDRENKFHNLFEKWSNAKIVL